MEALRRAQEASLAEARARAAGDARADQFERDVVAKSLIDEQRRADRARTFREVDENSKLMALEASREAYEAYERNELKRQERELRRFERERLARLHGVGYEPDEVKDESKLERRARDESQGVAESKEEPPAEDLDEAVAASLAESKADSARRRAAEDAELARLNWAAGMREIRLWEDGVEDEVMVMVNQNADKAEIMDPVSHQGILTLQSWTLVVLENQLVVAYNGQPRASERNEYASRMACTDVYGVAMFMLVARKPVENRPNLHELTFFTADLWDNYVTYVNMAREKADFFGGGAP